MQNRRQFIAMLPTVTALAAGCATATKAPTKRTGILDTHTHFYDPTRPQGVPWPPKNDRFLYRTVLPGELKAIAEPLGVTGTIVVEASAWVEDNEWVLSLARNEPFIQGLVGHLKPGKPNFTADLHRLSNNRLFRGIRVGLWDIPIQPENSDFIRDLKLLADRGLSLDVLGGPKELVRISQIAAHIPDLRIVIDHCAGVRITGGAPDPEWLNSVRMIAQHQNMHMKVSGLAEATGREHAAPRDVEFYRPTLDALWEAFGEDRVIFGSNWPVSARFADYPAVLKIVRDYMESKSRTAAEKYFSGNAERVYRPV
jgi:L-fuconolactonase